MEWPRKKTTRSAHTPTTKAVGDAAEDAALAHLQAAGLRLVQRNFRTPGRGGGEIDLIMREPSGTLVFVEVRQRASTSHGGAAASVGRIKQTRLVWAARHFLMRLPVPPPCRFDVVLVQGAGTPGDTSAHTALPRLDWIQAAFDATDT